MGKATPAIISFDKDFLHKLSTDSASSVTIQKDVKRIAMLPFRLTDIKASLKDILEKQIAKYDEKLDGILLGYQNVRLLDSDPITFDSSFTHVDIEAEFYVFKPTIGDVLTGIVNKKSKDHVGCLVYDTFNISLPKPKECDNWPGHMAQIGSDIKFTITYTDLDSRLPYIRGEIESIVYDDSGFSTEDGTIPHNTIIKYVDTDVEQPNSSAQFEEHETSKSSKKNKKKHKSIEVDEVQSRSDEQLEKDQELKPSKKKRNRKNSERHTGDEIVEEEIVNSSKKSKHLRNLTENSQEIEVEIYEEQESFENSKKHRKKKHKHSRDEEEIEEESPKKKRSRVTQEMEEVSPKKKRSNITQEMEEVSPKKKQSRTTQEIEEESPSKLSKKKRERQEETFEQPPNHHKKHKSRKHEVVEYAEENLDGDVSMEKVSKKKRKSGEEEALILEALDETKKKHKKKKKSDISLEDIEEGRKSKKKKHKDNVVPEINEVDEFVTKPKKHKKKKRQ